MRLFNEKIQGAIYAMEIVNNIKWGMKKLLTIRSYMNVYLQLSHY